MIFDKLKNLALLVLAAVSVSFGLAWGFEHIRSRVLKKRTQQAQTQVKVLKFNAAVQQEVEHEKDKLRDPSPKNLDSCADALFR